MASVREDLTPIAVVGIGCRFPGDATSPEDLWELVSKGRSAWTETSSDHFNVDAFYHPDGERKGTMNLRGGHFLKDDVARFDAPFFSITPNEAKAMDPQQRMMLEVAYEGLENAGLRMEDVVGSKTSCYVGDFSSRDYGDNITKDIENSVMYQLSGNAMSILSNRLSWFFDLKGPSMTIDTACSSSLVAFHLACQSLEAGESEMAIVAGANLILSPDMTIGLDALHLLSPDSRCYAFDHKANGYARGEGLGVVILKPLDAALRHNDMIRAVVRGSGVNQDGKTRGLHLPSTEAQEELIRSTYRKAGLELADTAYCEAHGTGTPAGDPLEARALAATFGKARLQHTMSPLLVGSVKSNIGHLEGGAGVAGLIKAVLALENGMIPPNWGFEKANPRIPMDEWNLQVPTKLTAWPAAGLRRASVNSFGFGGTNAHVIIDDALHFLESRGLTGYHNTSSCAKHCNPDLDLNTVNGNRVNGVSESSPGSRTMSRPSRPITAVQLNHPSHTQTNSAQPRLYILTSHDEEGIERQCKLYSEYLHAKVKRKRTCFEDEDGVEMELLERLSYTLARRRSVLLWRSFCTASSVAELCDKLERGISKPLRFSKPPRLAFIFTGQGAQWHAMGRQLWAYHIYQKSLLEADAYFMSLGCAWSLVEELGRDKRSTNINRATFSQPICTAIQVALVDLLKQWDIHPLAVVGHSSGEIAAAYCKGSISKETAWKLAYHRGRLCDMLQATAPHLKGAMMVAGLGEDDVLKYLDRVSEGRATIACVNSPSNVTVSGDASGINQLCNILDSEGIFARKLKVETAYHSHHMRLIADTYLRFIKDISILPTSETSDVKMFSSVTGKVIEGNDLGPQYWVDNLVSKVKFAQALISLSVFSVSKHRRSRGQRFVDMFLEVGPHSALREPLKQTLQVSDAQSLAADYASMLLRDNDAVQTALDAVGRLLTRGYPVNVAQVNMPHAESVENEPSLVDLPSYPWSRGASYWFEPRLSTDHRLRKHARQDLLGAPVANSSNLEPQWRGFLRTSENPWIDDHKVQSNIPYPSLGMIVMAIQAAQQLANDESRAVTGYELRDVCIERALLVPPEEGGIEVMLHFRPRRLGTRSNTSTWTEFVILSQGDEGLGWQQHCSGLIMTHCREGHTPAWASASEQAIECKHYEQRCRQVKATCTNTWDPHRFYDSLDSIGMQYGPAFRNLSEIRCSEHKAYCVARVPDIAAVMPHGFVYPHVIHTAFLESLTQMILPALMRPNKMPTQAVVGTYFESVYVSSDITTTPGDELQGYAECKWLSSRHAEGSVFVSNQDWERPYVVIKNARLTTLATGTVTEGDSANGNDENVRKPCSQMIWKEDVDLLGKDGAERLCSAAVASIAQVNPTIFEELELAAFVIIKRTLQNFDPETAKSFAPHHRKLYGWMRHQSDLMARRAVENQSGRTDWLPLDEEAANVLLRRTSERSIDGKLLYRVGQHIDAILKGEVEALQVMQADDLLNDMYRGGLGHSQTRAQLCAYMSCLVHKRPDINIIEIGGATADLTLPLLNTLGGRNDSSPWFASYTFTDISPEFVDKARLTLADWASNMHFQKLNIEEDPTQQGFEEGAYDVVVASNVSHATEDVDKTLAHIRSLLKPGGRLLMVESTHVQTRTTLILGCLADWWRGESDGRKWGPTLTVEEWEDDLTRQGFSGLDLALRDFENPRDYMISVIVSTAVPSPPPPPSPVTLGDVLVVKPTVVNEQLQNLSTGLVQRLSTLGALLDTSALGDTHEKQLREKIVIMLPEVVGSLLCDIQPTNFAAVKRLILNARATLWLTRGGIMNGRVPEANLVSGLARTIRYETGSNTLFTLDLDPDCAVDHDSTIDAILKIFSSICSPSNSRGADCEFARRNNFTFIPRVTLLESMNDLLTIQSKPFALKPFPFALPGRPLKLKIGTPGLLGTLHFADDVDAAGPLGEDEVEISVKASGLNSMDTMIAMNQLPDGPLGVECAGVVSRVGSKVSIFKPGNRLMTWGRGCHQACVRNLAAMFQPIPEEMSFEVATSIPIAYCTAYLGLVDRAHLKVGETILIHAAAGGIGQAAIGLAKYLGAEIFVTVESTEDKKILMDRYHLSEDHIFFVSDNDFDFTKGIMRMTHGHGVDVVLNSLAGEALIQTWHCIAMFGRFIDLGKKDIIGNTGLDMAPFVRNATFSSVDLIALYEHNLPYAAKIFAAVSRLMNEGTIQAVDPISAYEYSRVEEAFRSMQAGKHIGKIVLKARDDDMVPAISAARKYQFATKATYILVGGLGGLGRSIAQWMVDHGARNIVFLSRSGAQKPEAQQLVEALKRAGVRVTVYACDVGNRDYLQTVIQECTRDLPPIRGVIQGAMDLRDSAFENMTAEDWTGGLRPKVQGSRNLHECLPEDMDFFVMLSSCTGISGNRGQANYTAGNTYQDALALHRRAKGLPATSIDVGWMLGVGFVAENKDLTWRTRSSGLEGIGEDELHALLETAIFGHEAGGVAPSQIITGLSTGGMIERSGAMDTAWIDDAKFAHLRNIDTRRATDARAEAIPELKMQLRGATSLAAAATLVRDAIAAKLAKSLAVAVEDIDVNRPIHAQGVDSLVAIELRSWFVREFKAEVSALDILSALPLAAVAEKVAAKSQLVQIAG